MKKKYIRRALWAAASPFILFIILGILIYLPPIQKLLVDKAAVYASEATGMDIKVGRISLSFPLNLVMDNIEAASAQRDTLLNVNRLQVNVQLLPLLKKQLEIDAISLLGTTVNSHDLIHGMTLRGTVGELFVSSHGVALDPETAVVDKILLKDANLSLCLNDTTAADTTKTEPLYWKISLQDVDLQHVTFTLNMPADSMAVKASLKTAKLRNGRVDLHKGAYSLQQFSIEQGQVSYDRGETPKEEADTIGKRGFNSSHLALTEMNVQLDSLHFEGRTMGAIVRTFTLKEQSGLQVLSAEGSLKSNAKVLRVPSFRLTTSDSYLELNAEVDWNVIDIKDQGLITARLMADIGKPDMVRFIGGLDDVFIQKYPSEPLRIRTGIDGDLTQLKLTALSVDLPGAVELFAKGELTHLADTLKRGGDITLEARAKDLAFVTQLTGDWAIPYDTHLEGRFSMAGSRMGTDLLLMQPEAKPMAANDTLPITVANDTILFADDFKMERALRLYATYDSSRDAYEADLAINRLDLHQFLPKDSLYLLSARIHADGEGLDFMSPRTRVKFEGVIDRFHYASYQLSGIQLSAWLEKQKANASLLINNSMMEVSAHLDGTVKPTEVSGDLDLEIARLDWGALRLVNAGLQTSQHIDVHFKSDLKKRHAVEASMTHATVIAPKRTFHTKDLYVGFTTSVDSTKAYLRSGDFNLELQGRGHLDRLSAQAAMLTKKLSEQWEHKHIDQEELKQYLPGLCLQIVSGADNPISNYLSMQGLSYRRFYMDMDSSPEEGLNGESYLYGLRTDSLTLDTIYFDVQQDLSGLKFLSGVVNGPKPGQEAFDVSLEGSVGTNNAQLLVQYFNARKELGLYMGVMADLRRRGIRLHLFPEHPTLVYRPFTLNRDNYIFLSNKGRIHGNVNLHDEQGSGMVFYTNREDTIAKQDMTLELNRINMKEFRRILPYMPDVEGWIGAETHYIESGPYMMISSDVRIDDFNYEGNDLGNWEMNGVYLPGDKKDHHVDGYLRHNGKEIAHLGGIYLPTEDGTGNLSADVVLEHFPLHIVNPFIPERAIELTGDIDGKLAMKGDPAKPILDGELSLDSVTLAIPELSARFRFDNEPVKVVKSNLLFKDFDIFTQGRTPFTINGAIDFSRPERMLMDLKMHAENYELLNAPRTKRALVYGKMYVDFNATLRGPVEELVMRGNMNVLGKTNFTYVLKDSPLAVNDRLGDMVTFVNFNDTTEIENTSLQPVSLSGVDVALTMHIDQAAQARVDLTADGSNYMLLEGGGDLSFQYTPQGEMLLLGRYSLISGEMKYEIPVIPLKTFNIRNGSYVDWSGNLMNPQLNITATERVRASVGEDGQSTRMVSFDVGIVLSQRLENLGLAFTLSAPEDASVQSQLSAMSLEERGKLAITMLVTGMYLAEGNSTGGFNMNNALNSFLQSEISNIAGKALDISVGMETVDNAEDGGKRTDYNFQFAKRFWNNRFRIIIGGKVSTGNAAQQDETFIDNVSIEYRLDNSGTRYIKLFHDKNYESVLEGEIIETGIGIVLRRKVSNLGELFIFKSKKKK